MHTYTTYPFKISDKGIAFGPSRSSSTRKESARDRNDLCRDVTNNLRTWSGALTYNPNGTVRSQTQASDVA